MHFSAECVCQLQKKAFHSLGHRFAEHAELLSPTQVACELDFTFLVACCSSGSRVALKSCFLAEMKGLRSHSDLQLQQEYVLWMLQEAERLQQELAHCLEQLSLLEPNFCSPPWPSMAMRLGRNGLERQRWPLPRSEFAMWNQLPSQENSMF